MSNFLHEYFCYVEEIAQILESNSYINQVERMVELLSYVKIHHGRLFIIGIGGSAGNASHAVNDFRKLCHIEAYAPTDNVSEFSARINDEGWDTSFSEWLRVSGFKKKDALLVLSVGGGCATVSKNIVKAIDLALEVEATILGITGDGEGHTQQNSDVCIKIPTVEPLLRTPLVESFQAVVWHAIVNHPKLRK